MNTQTGISTIQTSYENYSKNLLDSIQKWTSIETDLLTQVTNLSGADVNATGVNTSDLNNPQTNKQIKKLLAEIANIEQVKTSIYNTLTTSYELTQQQIDAIRPVVASSNVANQLMADALNIKLEQLGEQIDLHNNSERMIGVNSYYAKRYEAHSSVMKKIVLFCGIIILVIFLMKIGFISDSISSVLIIATLVVGIIIVGKEVWDISRRSNIDFDRYNYPFDDKYLPPTKANTIDRKTNETYGREWVSNLCSDITKTASKIENSIEGDAGYIPSSSTANAGSGAGNGSTNGSGSLIPQPSSAVTTGSPMPSTTGQEYFALRKSHATPANTPSGTIEYYTNNPSEYNH